MDIEERIEKTIFDLEKLFYASRKARWDLEVSNFSMLDNNDRFNKIEEMFNIISNDLIHNEITESEQNPCFTYSKSEFYYSNALCQIGNIAKMLLQAAIDCNKSTKEYKIILESTLKTLKQIEKELLYKINTEKSLLYSNRYDYRYDY